MVNWKSSSCSFRFKSFSFSFFFFFFLIGSRVQGKSKIKKSELHSIAAAATSCRTDTARIWSLALAPTAIDKMCFNSFLMDFIRHLMHTHHTLTHTTSAAMAIEVRKRRARWQLAKINDQCRRRTWPGYAQSPHIHTHSLDMLPYAIICDLEPRIRGVSIKIQPPAEPLQPPVQMLRRLLLLLTEPSSSDRRTGFTFSSSASSPDPGPSTITISSPAPVPFRATNPFAAQHLPCMKLFNKNWMALPPSPRKRSVFVFGYRYEQSAVGSQQPIAVAQWTPFSLFGDY